MRRREINTIQCTLQQGEGVIPLKCCLLTSGRYPVAQATQYHHPVPTVNRLFVFVRGGAEVVVGGEVFRLVPGRCYLLPINQSFDISYAAGSDFVYVHFLLLDFVGLDAFRLARGVPELPPTPELCAELVEHYGGDTLADQARWQTAAFQAIIRFCAPWLATLQATLLKSWRFRPLFALLQAAESPARLTVKELAATLETTPAALSKGFQRSLGIPLKRYLRQQQLQQARELLGSSDLSIREVAAELGFTDPAYFHRLFHREVGWTPRAYRQRVRGGPYEPG